MRAQTPPTSLHVHQQAQPSDVVHRIIPVPIHIVHAGYQNNSLHPVDLPSTYPLLILTPLYHQLQLHRPSHAPIPI